MTLTKSKILESFKPSVHKVEIEGHEGVWVKAITELQRSKRISEMFDGNGNLTDVAKQRRRVHMIVDQLCDEDGSPLFNEGDIKDLLALDGAKLDPIVAAITAFNEPQEKNDAAE